MFQGGDSASKARWGSSILSGSAIRKGHMPNITLSLSDAQAADLLAQLSGAAPPVDGGGGTPPPPPPPPPPVDPALPKVLSDNSKAVYGTALTTQDGVAHSLFLKDGETAIFKVVVPNVPNFKVTHFQTNDVQNNTPTAAFVSFTPGDLRAQPAGRDAAAQNLDHGQWMSGDVQGGVADLAFTVDGGHYVEVVKGGSLRAVHCRPGDVLWLAFQFKDRTGRSTIGLSHGNVSVKMQ